jgi:plasmid rolling circle replication initiator protein Rep
LKIEETEISSQYETGLEVSVYDAAKKAAEKKAEKSDPDKKLQVDLKKYKKRKLKDYQGDRMPIEIAYANMGEGRKAERKHKCGTFLDYRISGEDVRLKHANFCQIPLCPMCAEIRSRKILLELSKIINFMEQERPYRFIHQTLTCANCHGRDLRDTLSLLFEAFYKMSHRMPFQHSIVGYFRKTEITHNWYRKDDYHPHLHILYAVYPEYFKANSPLYLPHAWWQEAWQHALGVDYTPQIRVRAIQKNPKKKNTSDISNVTDLSPILEVSKYVAKADQYVAPSRMRQSQNKTNEAVKWFDDAISGRRLVSYGGEFKRVHKLLNLDEPTDDDGTEEIREDIEEIARLFNWDFALRDYEEAKKKCLEWDKQNKQPHK